MTRQLHSISQRLRNLQRSLTIYQYGRRAVELVLANRLAAHLGTRRINNSGRIAASGDRWTDDNHPTAIAVTAQKSVAGSDFVWIDAKCLELSLELIYLHLCLLSGGRFLLGSLFCLLSSRGLLRGLLFGLLTR